MNETDRIAQVEREAETDIIRWQGWVAGRDTDLVTFPYEKGSDEWKAFAEGYWEAKGHFSQNADPRVVRKERDSALVAERELAIVAEEARLANIDAWLANEKARRDQREAQERRFAEANEQRLAAKVKRQLRNEAAGLPISGAPRHLEIYKRVCLGEKRKDIAKELGLSYERIRQMVNRGEQEQARRRRRLMLWRRDGSAGRPIDMGGPRDVWMTFSPGSDPRHDFMEPVRAE